MEPQGDFVRRPKTMNLVTEELEVQVENPIDIKSLKYHKCDIRSYTDAQGITEYLNGVLHGPTYEALVKDFWITAEIHGKEEASEEERLNIMVNPELLGKTREEMGMQPFKKPEIRSTVMGIEVVVNEDYIAAAMRCQATGKFRWGLHKDDPLKEVVNKALHGGQKEYYMSDMPLEHRMLLKVMNSCFFQKGGGTDQPKLDHHVFLMYLCQKEKMNIPKYIFYHMMWALRESQGKSRRKFVPFGRLLSEIFVQGGLIELLKDCPVANDKDLQTCTGKPINANTLKAMKIIDNVTKLSTDLSPKNVVSDLLKDFPPISKHDNKEVCFWFIKKYYEDTGRYIEYNQLPEGPEETLRVKRKTSKRKQESEKKPAAKKPKKEKKVVQEEEVVSQDESVDTELKDLYETIDNMDLKETRTRSGKIPEASAASEEITSEVKTASEEAKSQTKKRKLKKVKGIQLSNIDEEEEVDDMPLRTRRRILSEAPASEEVIEKAVEVAGNTSMPLASLMKERAKENAQEVVRISEALKEKASDEASFFMKKAMETKREAGSDQAAGSSMPGNSQFIAASGTEDSNIVKPVKTSLDIPLSQAMSSLTKSLTPTPSTTTQKKLTNTQKHPINIPDDTIDDKLEGVMDMTDRYFSNMNLPPPVRDFQPLTVVQPSGSFRIVSDDLSMSSSKQQTSSSTHNSPSNLQHLEKHISGGELIPTPQKASGEEVTTMVASESEFQQQPLQLQMASEASVHASEEHNDESSSSDESYIDADLLKTQQHREIEAMFSDSESAIPQNSQTLEIGQSSFQTQPSHQNLATTSNQNLDTPKPPSVLLESIVLRGCCSNIFEDLHNLVEASKMPILPGDYLEKWDILKHSVDNIFCHLRRLCIERHKDALFKWFEDVIKSLKSMRSQEPVLMLSDAPFFIDLSAAASASIQQGVEPNWVLDLATTTPEASTSASATEELNKMKIELMEEKLINEELRRELAMQKAEFKAKEEAGNLKTQKMIADLTKMFNQTNP